MSLFPEMDRDLEEHRRNMAVIAEGLLKFAFEDRPPMYPPTPEQIRQSELFAERWGKPKGRKP